MAAAAVSNKWASKAWRVSWNSKAYDYEKRLQAAKMHDSDRFMYQSWGNRPTTNIGEVKVCDTLYITCDKHCVAVATVVEPFREYSGDEIPTDVFAKEPTSPTLEREARHANNMFCRIYLREIPSKPMRPLLPGNQNTFSQGQELKNFLNK